MSMDRKYDTCFLKWYSESRSKEAFQMLGFKYTDQITEYLRGLGKAGDNECTALYKEYQKCLNVREPFAIHSALAIFLWIPFEQ